MDFWFTTLNNLSSSFQIVFSCQGAGLDVAVRSGLIKHLMS